MARISETTRRTKNGLEVTILSPPADAAAEILDIAKLVMASSKHLLTEADELKLTVEQEGQWIQSCLDHPDRVIIVPMIAGKVVGIMNFSGGDKRRNSHQGEFGMSVHPDFQGVGIGRLMLAELIAWAASHPRLETLRLKVHAQNSNAIALYRSMGFVEEGRERRAIKLGRGSYDDVVTMARTVKEVP